MVLRQLLAVTQLLCVVGAAAEARKSLREGATAEPDAEQLPPSAKQAALLELSNATLAARLRDVASPERCIIFTTTSAFLPPLLNMTRNWFAHVHKCGATPQLPPGIQFSRHRSCCCAVMVRMLLHCVRQHTPAKLPLPTQLSEHELCT